MFVLVYRILPKGILFHLKTEEARISCILYIDSPKIAFIVPDVKTNPLGHHMYAYDAVKVCGFLLLRVHFLDTLYLSAHL